MIDAHPDNLALMEIHDGDSYEVPWGTTRDAYYQAGWTPFACWDGLQDAWPINTYESKFLARQAIPTDVTIDVLVFGPADTWSVHATVCVEAGGTGKDMNVWMAQLLDHYGPVNFDRNKVQDGSTATLVSLGPGECTTVVESFTLNALSQASPDDVKFFVWAQDPVKVYDPEVQNIGGTWYGAYFAEVYQAGKALAPFKGVLVNGFETGDFSGWTVPTQ